jgi:hypothetical protein
MDRHNAIGPLIVARKAVAKARGETVIA